MDIRWIRRWRPDVSIRRGAETCFESMGFCFYETAMLCTYAEEESELAFAEENPNVSVILVSAGIAPRRARRCSLVVCDDPARLFYELHNHLATDTDFYGTPRKTRVHAEAKVDERAHIEPHGVTIGAGAVVEPFVTLHSGTTLERDVVVRAGAVVGSEAAQMRTFGKDRISLIHRGGVRVRAGAEIGVHAVVCASIFNAPTSIGRNAYLGPQVAVAHQVTVGAGALVLAGAILFGTCDVGPGAFVAPGALVSNGVTVGRRAFVSPGALVTRDVAAGARVTGYFAVPHQEFLERLRRAREGGHGA